MRDFHLHYTIGLHPLLFISAIYGFSALCDRWKMIAERKQANEIADTREMAIAYCDNVKGKYFDIIRNHVDKLELLVDDACWLLPKYRELLFLR